MLQSGRTPLEAYYALAGIAGTWAKGAFAKLGPMPLRGQLYVSQHTGRLLLRVPSALIAGVYAGLQEPGWQLYSGKDKPHVVVMTSEELTSIGGPDVITERGFHYGYRIEHPQIVQLDGMEQISRACVLPVHSSDLKKLRSSYGLSDTPRGDKSPFHAVVAVRMRNVFQAGDAVTKTKNPFASSSASEEVPASSERWAFPATRDGART